MSLFDKIFRPNKAKESEAALKNARTFFQTLTAYKPAFTDWKGEIYEADLVRSAIDSRARHISKLKIDMYGSAQQGLKTKLMLAPSQYSTWSQFLYRVSTILDCTNNCCIVPVFDDSMRITGYYPVLPDRCEIVEYLDEPWMRYKFPTGKTAAVELRKCAILTKFQFKDDFFGSKNDALDETMQVIDLQNQGIEEAVKNGASYRFIARLNNFSKPEDIAKERRRFSEENFAADSGAGGLLLFPNIYTDIQQVNQNPFTVDAAQMELIQANVYNYFGTNKKIIQNLATADELDSFFNGCVEPFAIQFSESMTKAIYSENERAHGNRLVANANRLQYMSVTQKVAMAQQLLDRGVLSINEARELFNYHTVDDGDIRYIRGEYKDAEPEELQEEGKEDGNNE